MDDDDTIFKLLQELYTDKTKPSHLASPNILLNEALKLSPDITREDVDKFLKSQDSYTLMVEKPRRFKRRKYRFSHPGHTLCGDVAYLNEFKQSNYKFLLFLMDGYSRYLFVFPLKSLKQCHVVPCIENVIKDSIFSIKNLFTDRGSEFWNSGVNRLMEKYKINHYSTRSETKCGVIERVIKTLKRKFSKFVIEYNNEKFIDYLDCIVLNYNVTPHSGILNETPLDIYTMHNQDQIMDFSLRINRKHFLTFKSFPNLLERGTVVRLSCMKKTFSRAIYLQNTVELFSIHDIKETIPPVYVIKDLAGNIADGTFYRQEIIPVVHKNIYPVKIIRKRKKGRKVEYLVEWVGYPHEENQWIRQSDLEKL